MRAFHFVEHIDRPPRVVWDAITDLTVAAKWRPLVVSMEFVDGLPLHQGSEVRTVFEVFGRRETRLSKTVALEPLHRWVLHAAQNPEELEGFFEVVLEPDGNGTRVTSSCELKAHKFLSWLFLPLIARAERQRRSESLGKLKRFVETR